MVHKEIEVINKIRNSKDPDRAMQIAMQIILDHLVQRELSQSQLPSLPQETYEAT